jgi:hypothetical protein
MSAWFKPKDVGYGNVPSTWQGWAVTIGFALFVIGVVVAVENGALARFWGLVVVLAGTVVYVPFIRRKTSGEWRWRSRPNQ